MQLEVVVAVIAYLNTQRHSYLIEEETFDQQTTRRWWKWWWHHQRSFLEKKTLDFFFSRIEGERTVLYWGGAETVTGVPNSGTSFGILSLHRLTLAVAGADDDDDGSTKRMRRRSKNKEDQHGSRSKQWNVPFDAQGFGTVDVSKNQIHHIELY